jgi:hypothetical protein
MDLRYELRDARDTLIDLLPLKSTYPIRNLPVRAERDIVPFKGFTYVIIDFSQAGVFYEVYDNTGRKMADKVLGNGGSLTIKTLELTNEDYTFSVTATKAISGLTKVLLQTVTVKTGVDTTITVRLKQPIFDYNTKATVILDDAQRGNKYQVLDMKGAALSAAVVSGEGGYLEIVTTGPVTEDIQVQVVATNIKTAQTGVMDTKPTILVAPNDMLVPALKQPLVDYNGTGVVTLPTTQKSVSYQLMYVDIDDEDLAKVLAASPMIGAPVKGNAATIELPAAKMTEDMTVQVVATKDNGSRKILKTQILIPVKPDPSRKLSVVEAKVLPDPGATIKVSKTQKGILYQLRAADNTAIGWPRFHSRNYGIGRAILEVNFAVDAFTDDSVYLPTGPMKATATFNVLAIKATTKASVQLTDTITVTI